MKKVLVVLLILAVAGGVFAQDITWSGTVETGVHIQKHEGQDDATIWAYNDDNINGLRAKLQAAIAGDNWGFKIGVKSETWIVDDPGSSELDRVLIYNGFGWFDFLDKMINVKGGLIDDAVWTTRGDQDFNLSSNVGVRVEVTPIEGLNVGLLLTWPDGGAAIDQNGTVEQFFKETVLGFSYTSDLFYVTGAFKLDSDGDGGTDKDAEAIFGFGYTGIPALTANIEAHLSHLGGYSDDGKAYIDETIAYQVMEPLTVGAVLTEELSNTGGKSDDMKLTIKPYLTYLLSDTMSVGLNLPAYLQDGFVGFDINPWFKYALGDNASFKIGYTAGIVTEKKTSGVVVRASELNHDVQATFVWSF
jgi:hypothetical protein